ncbi:hypothetical protein I3842_05G033100 [Carya illinoinensis]|uniref:Fe2OG dioxygenase domain-containing protein n=1 Tax=Carya illinoinensis TaxID=32201 RepID=A0A922EWS1_CARIL|nr:hypothetical protein I3842_05G033100 [Carya illinoinensis]
MELGLQLFISNFFPPCPQPELAMGLPPHSDPTLLTLLINNGISGLQLQRQGKWVNVNSIPNAFMVIFGDQMEIMSNGKYECAVHRATVNEKATRMSIAMLFGPALETVVGPAPELVDNETINRHSTSASNSDIQSSSSKSAAHKDAEPSQQQKLSKNV